MAASCPRCHDVFPDMEPGEKDHCWDEWGRAEVPVMLVALTADQREDWGQLVEPQGEDGR
jgi:hypothetical protein